VIDIPVPVVLASSSPVRRDLLRQLVPAFEVVAPQVEEAAVQEASPAALAVRLALLKARQVSARRPEALVIAADTLVVCNGEVIGKPADRADAVRIMRKLTSSSHRVVTGICIIAPGGRTRTLCPATSLRLRRMSPAEIERYVDSPGALQRAGVYALQPDDPNVLERQGSATCVMGLPMDELAGLLRELYPHGERA
jgi:nucleoside triphosphate pyrophosphatase